MKWELSLIPGFRLSYKMSSLNLIDLPSEILNVIAGRLEWKEYNSFRETCKKIREALSFELCFPSSPVVVNKITDLVTLPFKNFRKLIIGFEENTSLEIIKNYPIQDLWLISRETSDIDLQIITDNCEYIHSIDLCATSITDNGLKILCEKFKDLRSLNISRTGVTDIGLEHIANNCKDLEELWLGDSEEISSWGIVKIAENCKNLQKLYMVDLNINDMALISLSTHCRKLHRLTLENVNVFEESIILMINRNKNLLYLSLKELGLGKKTAKAIGDNCKSLRTLFISRNLIFDDDIKYISENCKELYNVDFESSEITNIGVKHLFDNCKKLSIANLWYNNIDNECTEYIISDTLTHLNLTNTLIGIEGIHKIAVNCKNLVFMQLPSCNLSTGDMDEFKRKYPNIEIM